MTGVPALLPANELGLAFAPLTSTVKLDALAAPPAVSFTETKTVSVLVAGGTTFAVTVAEHVTVDVVEDASVARMLALYVPFTA